MTEIEQNIRETADKSLSVLGKELLDWHALLEEFKGQGVDTSGMEKHVAFLEGMAVGANILGDGFVPGGDLTAGGPFAMCVRNGVYGKMEDLLGKEIRPRKKRVPKVGSLR